MLDHIGLCGVPREARHEDFGGFGDFGVGVSGGQAEVMAVVGVEVGVAVFAAADGAALGGWSGVAWRGWGMRVEKERLRR
jgi:hypothetical protein